MADHGHPGYVHELPAEPVVESSNTRPPTTGMSGIKLNGTLLLFSHFDFDAALHVQFTDLQPVRNRCRSRRYRLGLKLRADPFKAVHRPFLTR